jgi:DNA-directed RNA polymerase specialized sigma24 family protein
MSYTGSVTCWINQLKAGQREAAQPLWERYFEKLVARSRDKLAGRPRGAADEEDVALSAFDSFCRAAEQGRFPDLADREGLWRLLLALTERKAIDLVRRERRRKRGGGKVLDEAGFLQQSSPSEEGPLERIPDPGPSPAFAALVAEECQRLLRLLADAELQSVAVRKMEGYTIEEIAEKNGVAPRTVRRKLQRIRHLWEQELSS